MMLSHACLALSAQPDMPSRCVLPQVHTIGFQAGGGEAMLRRMAAAAPGGRFHSCQSGVDLASAFTSIAAGCSAVDGLVQRFAEILSEQISIKIMHDYL